MTAWLNFADLDPKPAREEQSAALAGFSPNALGKGFGSRAAESRLAKSATPSSPAPRWQGSSAVIEYFAPQAVEELNVRELASRRRQQLPSEVSEYTVIHGNYDRVDSLVGQERFVLDLADAASEQSGYLQRLELRVPKKYEAAKTALSFDAPSRSAHGTTFQDDVIGAIVRWLPGVSSVHFEEETDPDDGQRLPIVTIGASSTPEALLAAESSVFDELTSKGRAQEWVNYAISYRFA